MKFLREAKTAGAWCDIEKPFWNDVPIWLATGLADSVGICQNHMQIAGMLDSEAWGRPRDLTKYPGPLGNGFYTQDLYYHILNCGLRLPPTAGGASGVLANPVGYNRVYVRCDGPFTWEKWWAGLKSGRVFVSNGPNCACMRTTNGPGMFSRQTLRSPSPSDGKLDSRDPIRSVELVIDGTASTITLPHRFEMKSSGWFLVRALTTVPQTFRFASTAPWFVEIGGRRAAPRRESVQFMLEWTQARRRAVEQSLSEHPQRLEEVAKPIPEAEQFWRKPTEARPMMHGSHFHGGRRQFLASVGGGFAGLALSHLFARDLAASPIVHHPPKVKRIIQLFMTGGASPMDTFDYKPELERLHGQMLGPKEKPEGFTAPAGALMKSPFPFAQHGQCGRWVSSVFPRAGEAGRRDGLSHGHALENQCPRTRNLHDELRVPAARLPVHGRLDFVRARQSGRQPADVRRAARCQRPALQSARVLHQRLPPGRASGHGHQCRQSAPGA